MLSLLWSRSNKKTGINGEFYGHKYYKQTDCKHSWSSLDDLKTETMLVEDSRKSLEEKKAKYKDANEKNFDFLYKQQQELFSRLGRKEDEDVYG